MIEPILKLTSELELEFQSKIEARNPQKDRQNTRESKNRISEYLTSDFIKFCRLKAAETKKTNSPEKPDIWYRDNQDRSCITRDKLKELNNLEALARHGNDPDKRFDEWSFPGTPAERKFLLNHDFGAILKNCLSALESGNWVYAFGEVGNGKTALAMRAIFEFLKSRPARKASFVFMNQYSLDQIRRENAEQTAINRGNEIYNEKLNFHNLVVLDDFDKINYRNEYKVRTVLNLVERLKKDEHRVFLTSQISLGKLYERYKENWDMKPLIDRLRQMCLILPEFKGPSKRKYET